MEIQPSETTMVKGSLVGCTPRDDTRGWGWLIKLLSSIFILTFIAAGCNRQTNSPAAVAPTAPAENYNHQLQIGAQTLNVEIANTPAERQQGLSDRKSMAQNQGMLFNFGSPVTPAFWMKDMNFNLDFIWIAGGKVVGIASDVPAPQSPADKLQLYYPPSAVDEVLEVNAGWAKKNNITAGDEVKFAQ
jgi:hypothetical protein